MSPQKKMRRGKVSPKTSRNNNNSLGLNFGSTTPNQLYADTFPREMKIQCRYHDFFDITTAGGVSNDHMFNLNSMFDPDRSGTGHQPLSNDQWAAFYGRYRVDATKVTITATTTSTHGSVISMIANNSTSSLTDSYVVMESPGRVSAVCNAGSPSVKISKIFNLADVNGVTREVYRTDDRYQAQFGSSPTETIILHVGAFETLLGASVDITYSTDFIFYVTLFDPLQLSIS